MSTRLVASFVGTDPAGLPTCPWRAVEHPLVADVMRLRLEREAGLTHERPVSPRLREAMAEFHQAYRDAIEERKRRESDEAEAAREHQARLAREGGG